MGQCLCSNSVEPEDTIEKQKYASRNSNNGAESNELLEAKDRSCTDIIALVILIVFIVGLVALLGYCIYYGDIYRILNGYDDCANVCGRPNVDKIDPRSSCKREDMTMKKLLVINSAGQAVVEPNSLHRACVETCNTVGFREFFNRCIPEKSEKIVNTFFSKTGVSNFFDEVTEDLSLCWREIVYLCLIAFAFSIVILILFRFVVGFVIWLVLIGVALTSLIGTIFLWITWVGEKNALNEIAEKSRDEISKRKVHSYLAYALIATVVTAVVLLVLLVMRKRIALVIQLFKEAGKAIASMPALLFEPIVTFAALALTIGLWIYLSLWVESAGILTLETNQSLHYRKDITMKVCRWYNLFALFWITQFIIGCQHMLIAGAVASWFFTRNKTNMCSPIVRSSWNVVRFHLGTVALGSLLIAIVQMMRAILTIIQKRLKGSSNRLAECIFKCCQCCLYCFEKFLQYLSRNAYIETAIFGYSFCRAGQKAFGLLANNALRVAAINSVGDFILFLGKALVVMITVLIGIELIQKKEGVQHVWVPLSIAGLVAYLTSHCFMTVYEMAIDTIFLCFCEDCERNDGISRPYYMSRGLMEFVQNSKKALQVIQDSDPKEAWTAPKTISQHVDR